MNLTLRIGKFRGIDLLIHPTFYLVFIIGALTWSGHGWQGMLFGIASMMLMFLSVLLHEMGHAVVAQLFGIQSKDITLYPFGGMCKLMRRPTTPRAELLISLAGPAVNAVIFVLMWVPLHLLLGVDWIRQATLLGMSTPSVPALIVTLMFTNAVLAVFNLIPAFPMDGGRIFRATLWKFIGFRRGTTIAKKVAFVLGMAGLGLALAKFQVILGFIAVMVLLAARAENEADEPQEDENDQPVQA